MVKLAPNEWPLPLFALPFGLICGVVADAVSTDLTHLLSKHSPEASIVLTFAAALIRLLSEGLLKGNKSCHDGGAGEVRTMMALYTTLAERERGVGQIVLTVLSSRLASDVGDVREGGGGQSIGGLLVGEGGVVGPPGDDGIGGSAVLFVGGRLVASGG